MCNVQVGGRVEKELFIPIDLKGGVRLRKRGWSYFSGKMHKLSMNQKAVTVNKSHKEIHFKTCLEWHCSRNKKKCSYTINGLLLDVTLCRISVRKLHMGFPNGWWCVWHFFIFSVTGITNLITEIAKYTYLPTLSHLTTHVFFCRM